MQRNIEILRAQTLLSGEVSDENSKGLDALAEALQKDSAWMCDFYEKVASADRGVMIMLAGFNKEDEELDVPVDRFTTASMELSPALCKHLLNVDDHCADGDTTEDGHEKDIVASFKAAEESIGEDVDDSLTSQVVLSPDERKARVKNGVRDLFTAVYF